MEDVKADYIDKKTRRRVFRRMQPANAAICRVALATGLRIDDVCRLRTAQLNHARSHSGWLVVTEQKTGKRRRVRLSRADMRRFSVFAGRVYVFPGRRDPDKHRTRQRVWRDFTKARLAVGAAGHVSPHSLRKLYAVSRFEKSGDLAKVQRMLNHDSPATTVLYVMSRELTKAENKPKKKR